MATLFQGDIPGIVDRKDHVWIRRASDFKCVLCGAVSKAKPPKHPTPKDWMPDRYEELTGAERGLCV